MLVVLRSFVKAVAATLDRFNMLQREDGSGIFRMCCLGRIDDVINAFNNRNKLGNQMIFKSHNKSCWNAMVPNMSMDFRVAGTEIQTGRFGVGIQTAKNPQKALAAVRGP